MSKQINVDLPDAEWNGAPSVADIQAALGSQKLLSVLRVSRSDSGWSALVEVEAKKAKPALKQRPKSKAEPKAKATPKKSLLGSKSDSE